MPASPSLLLICQAGQGVGLGHLSRCLVAARAIQGKGVAVTLLIQSEKLERSDLGAFEHHFIDHSDDLLARVDQLLGLQPFSTLVLDLQPAKTPALLVPALRRWRQKGLRVIGIDSLRLMPNEVDLLFIPSFHYQATSADASHVPTLFGWDCLLIDGPRPEHAWEPGPRVLALTGGSDATGLGRHWPRLLDAQLPSGSEVDWVTGPFAQAPVLDQAAQQVWREHVAPNGLGPLMSQCHYAVTIYGVSFFELLYQGIPTVVFSPYGDKDHAELDLIAQAGVAWVARDEYHATELLATLMKQPEHAAQLSRRASALLCTSGGERLADAITSTKS
ncbi:hypothetical protein [Roseateles sp.]|uniref:hypothetical protein n=1 Tax=Roseateles sp. TaxID=1971397 RepID=UPI003BA7675A